MCPHAGYKFSGKTAAIGYKQLAGRKFRTVIVLGPSHTRRFDGAALPAADAIETPLGQMPLSPKAADPGQASPSPSIRSARCSGRTGGGIAPSELPAFGDDTPFTWEHSVEVQVPFLQRMLRNFSVVPVVFGRVDPGGGGEALCRCWTTTRCWWPAPT